MPGNLTNRAEPLPPILDRWRLLLLVTVALVVHVTMIKNSAMTARDSIGFVRDAWNFKHPESSRLAYMKQRPQHPGYPVLVAVVSNFVPGFAPDQQYLQLLRSSQVTSALCGILLVFPVFWIGRAWASSNVGLLAGLFVTLLPVIARDTSDGLSDGPYLLSVCCSLAFGVKGLRMLVERRWPSLLWFALCGVAGGLSYLIRPEGLVLPVVSFIVLLVCLVGRVAKPWQLITHFCILFACFAVCAAPYMLLIGRLTNKPAMLEQESTLQPTAGPIFAETISQSQTGFSRLGAALVAGMKEVLKTGHYGVAVFGLIGVCVLFPFWRRDPKFWFPLVFLLIHVGVLLTLAYRSGYVSERHTIPAVTILAIAAAAGLKPWHQLWLRTFAKNSMVRWKHWPVLIAFALILSCLTSLAKPLHENRAGHAEAGARLREELLSMTPEEQESVVILDHYEWAQYYIGPLPGTRWAQNLYRIPSDPSPDRQRIRFVVLEEKGGETDRPKFDSPRHQEAVALKQNPNFQWQLLGTYPKQKATGSIRVSLYRADVTGQ